MSDVTPIIDVDCVDNETMLIVERDAAEVIVPEGAVVGEGLFEAKVLAEGMLEVVSMGIVPVPVEVVPVGVCPMTMVPLVEALATVGATIEGPLLERRLSEVLGRLVDEPVFVFMVTTVEESIFNETEDEEPGTKEPLGVTELEKKIPLA